MTDDAAFTLRQDKSIYIAIDTVQCTVTWEIYTDTERASAKGKEKKKTQEKCHLGGKKKCLKAWIMKDEEICAAHPK